MMADSEDNGRRAPPVDMQQTARDWITIWQSELSALAVDRETQEAWLRGLALWSDSAKAAARLWAGVPDDHPSARPGAVAPAGPAPSMAASGSGDDALHRLAERVEKLEHLRAVPPSEGS